MKFRFLIYGLVSASIFLLAGCNLDGNDSDKPSSQMNLDAGSDISLSNIQKGFSITATYNGVYGVSQINWAQTVGESVILDSGEPFCVFDSAPKSASCSVTYLTPDPLDVESRYRSLEFEFQATAILTNGAIKRDRVKVVQQGPDSQMPVANAGTDRVVSGGDLIILSGSASRSFIEFEGEVTPLTYTWELITNPDNIPFVNTFVGEEFSPGEAPYLNLDSTITYRLTVRDALGQESTNEVSITILASLDITPEQPVLFVNSGIYDQVVFDDSLLPLTFDFNGLVDWIYDPDEIGGVIYSLWVSEQFLPASEPLISNAGSAEDAYASINEVGDYIFRLYASDAPIDPLALPSDYSEVLVRVVASDPMAPYYVIASTNGSGEYQKLDAGGSILAILTASDSYWSDGSTERPMIYYWINESAPVGYTFADGESSPTLNLGLSTSGVYEFRVFVAELGVDLSDPAARAAESSANAVIIVSEPEL
ncbi:MAG: hypothetical protein IBX55_01525 [Methyloprofundus sp.]|nr:hypothetical protein [Methyloprofundus sp.]